MLKRSYIVDFFICIGFMALAGMTHVFYPTEIRWDLANYHYYNAWAFFHNRLGYDIVPAMINTYFNPLIDIPYYLMLNTWGDASIVKFLQGSYYGILVFIFYKIVNLFFDLKKEPLAFCLTIIIGATGFACLSQLGKCSNEIQISILILWGVYIILKHIGDDKRHKSVWIWSGLLMGAALGFKPTVISYCAAMGLTLILFMKPLKISFKEIMIFATFGLLGYLIINGWWMWQLYSHFDNPFFPFLNKIFRSEYYDLINIRDTTYIEKTTWWQKLFLPFFMSFLSLKKLYVSESTFVDLRYVLVYIVSFFMFVKWLCHGRKLPDSKYLLLYIFILFSYIFWVCAFCIIRYIIPIEILSAIIIVKFFQKINFRSFFAYIFLVSFEIIGFYILVSEAPNYLSVWGGAMPFMLVEKINLPKDALVRTYGYPVAMAAAQLIGNQPNRIVGYANGGQGPLIDFLEYLKFSKERAEIERNHQGPFVALITYNVEGKEAENFYNASFRRMLFENEGMYCRALKTYVDIIDICVPQELKDEIFVEKEVQRKIHFEKKSNTLNRELNKALIMHQNEMNKIFNQGYDLRK